MTRPTSAAGDPFGAGPISPPPRHDQPASPALAAQRAPQRGLWRPESAERRRSALCHCDRRSSRKSDSLGGGGHLRRAGILRVAHADGHPAIHQAVDKSRKRRRGYALARGQVTEAYRHAPRDGRQCGELRLGQLTASGAAQAPTEPGDSQAQARRRVTVRIDGCVSTGAVIGVTQRSWRTRRQFAWHKESIYSAM